MISEVRARSEMHEYQDRVVAFQTQFRADERARISAVWMSVGLGKTVCTLTSVSDLIDAFAVRNALVVGPLKVSRKTWTDEIAKWEHVDHLRVSLMVGDADTRLAALYRKADIHIINVENLEWLEKQLGKDNMPWDALVMDEGTLFKNRDTVRFKVLRRLARKAIFATSLSATPCPNGYLDLWGQFYLLDGGKRLGPSFTAYKRRFFDMIDRDGRKWVLKKGAAEAIQDLIRDITITLDSKDYLKMPDRIDRFHEVDLDDAETTLYDQMERDYVLQLDDDVEIDAISAAALGTKLQQLANGQIYDREKNVHTVHGRKIEKLREIVEASEREPMLVAYSFQSDRDRILREFPQARLLRTDADQDAWNRGEIEMLLAHPASAGHGLNLQFGGRHVVWFGLPWSLELYMQFNGRLERQGQLQPVIVHHIVTRRSIDMDIAAALRRKHGQQSTLLEAMKRRVDVILSGI